MSLIGSSNEEKIWNYFKSKGLNDFGCAGLLANLFAESALNSKNLQNSYEKKLGYTDETYTAAVDNGVYTNFVRDSAGYGLAQWTYWSRKQNLLNYAKSIGKSIGDLEMQLDFLWKELNEGYTTSVLAVLKSATSILQASNAVLFKFESPADQSETVQANRASYGQTYYDKYVIGNVVNNIMTSTGINKYTKGIAVKLSFNFMSTEFDCHGKGCCSQTYIDSKLVEHLQNIRDHFNAPVSINSGYRCEKHNSAVGGASQSYHKRDGRAADIVVKGIAPLKVAQYAESLGILGIGLYNDFVHIDTRTTKSYWYGSNEEPRTTFGKYVDNTSNNKVSDSSVSVPTTPITPNINTTPTVTTTSTTNSIKVNDVVKIAANATYYSGKEVPSWVKEKNWIVKSVSGDIVVIDKSTDGKNSICSPINAKYLTVVNSTGSDVNTTFNPYNVKVTADALNIRSGAGTNYGKVGIIKDNGVYTIVDEATGQGASKWGLLKSYKDNHNGWISLDYCKKI